MIGKTLHIMFTILMVNFIVFPSVLNAQQENTIYGSNGGEPNWSQLIDNANREALLMRDSADNALERDLKRNLDSWGNKNMEPFYMHVDSIFYRVFYAENVFDLLAEVDDFKERFVEMQKYTKPYDAVQLLLNEMAVNNKTLYLLMVSKETNRRRLIPINSNEYKLFGIYAGK